MEKVNEIQLTKKKDLNNRKMTNHPPSPVTEGYTSPCSTSTL